jgi:hypothetical protein
MQTTSEGYSAATKGQAASVHLNPVEKRRKKKKRRDMEREPTIKSHPQNQRFYSTTVLKTVMLVVTVHPPAGFPLCFPH